MKDPTEQPSLKSLGERLKRARGDAKDGMEESRSEAPPSALIGAAWRLTVEMVVAPLACGAFGWWLDDKFGTRPWLLLVFLLLGCVTGGMNAYRTAQRIGREQAGETVSADKNKIGAGDAPPAGPNERVDLGRKPD